MEDSGFISCRALPNNSDASFSNPTYLPMHPGLHPQKNSMRSNSVRYNSTQKTAVLAKNSLEESGRSFSFAADAGSKSCCDKNLPALSRDTLLLDSNRADADRAAGESHVIEKDSCQSGSLWSNSSRYTVIDNGRKVFSSAATREARRQNDGDLPPEPFPSLLPGLVEQKCGDHFQESRCADPAARDRKNISRDPIRDRKHPIKIPLRKTNSVLHSGGLQ